MADASRIATSILDATNHRRSWDVCCHPESQGQDQHYEVSEANLGVFLQGLDVQIQKVCVKSMSAIVVINIKNI